MKISCYSWPTWRQNPQMRPWSSCACKSRSKRASCLASRQSGAPWTRWDCREKKSVLAAEADLVERAGFRKMQERLPVTPSTRQEDNTSLRLREVDDFELDAMLSGRIQDVCPRSE